MVTGNINVANQINVMNVAGRRKRRHSENGPISNELPIGPIRVKNFGHVDKDCWKARKKMAAQVSGFVKMFLRNSIFLWVLLSLCKRSIRVNVFNFTYFYFIHFLGCDEGDETTFENLGQI